MKNLFSSPLNKEICIILAIKLMLLITIKILWFSTPQQNVELSIENSFLGHTPIQIEKETN